MTDSSGQSGPGPTGFERFESVAEKATSLGGDIAAVASDLSTASRDALKAGGGSVIGSSLEEAWPLRHDILIEQLLEEKAEARMKACGSMALHSVQPQEIMTRGVKVVNSLVENKYSDTLLEQVYGSEDPRFTFINDFIKWAEGMEQRGWPAFVRIDLREGHRVTVSVYEDEESTRNYLKVLTDRTGLGEEETAEDYSPDVWVSKRVIVVDDDEDLTTSLKNNS